MHAVEARYSIGQKDGMDVGKYSTVCNIYRDPIYICTCTDILYTCIHILIRSDNLYRDSLIVQDVVVMKSLCKPHPKTHNRSVGIEETTKYADFIFDFQVHLVQFLGSLVQRLFITNTCDHYVVCVLPIHGDFIT